MGLTTAFGILVLSQNVIAARPEYVALPFTDEGNTIWGQVSFGRYIKEQDAAWEPIIWRVLTVEEDTALLLAEENIDACAFCEGDGDGSWENSHIRDWLNGYFLENSFTQKEREAIETSFIVTKENPDYGTYDGNETFDKVFLLSVDEVMNPNYGFSSKKEGDTGRCSQNTPYTAIGGTDGDKMRSAGMADYWWLRTPGVDDGKSAIVTDTGYVVTHGLPNSYRKCAVRPAIRLNLSDETLWRHQGLVDEKGNHLELSNMRAEKEKMVYQVGEKLYLEDLKVEACFGTYWIPVLGYETNADDIDMTKPGIKELVIRFEAGETQKSYRLYLEVEEGSESLPSQEESENSLSQTQEEEKQPQNINGSGSQTTQPEAQPWVKPMKSVADVKVSTKKNKTEITWKPDAKASGYRVKIYNTKTKKTVIRYIEKPKLKIKKSSGYQRLRIEICAYQLSGTEKIFAVEGSVRRVLKIPGKVVQKKPLKQKRSVKIRWKKKKGSGYQIQVATNRRFTKGKKTFVVRKANIVNKQYSGLKKGKTYYIRVRAYIRQSGIKHYGIWSKIQKMKWL